MIKMIKIWSRLR